MNDAQPIGYISAREAWERFLERALPAFDLAPFKGGNKVSEEQHAALLERGRLQDQRMEEFAAAFRTDQLRMIVVHPAGREFALPLEYWQGFFPDRIFLADDIDPAANPTWRAYWHRTPFVEEAALEAWIARAASGQQSIAAGDQEPSRTLVRSRNQRVPRVASPEQKAIRAYLDDQHHGQWPAMLSDENIARCVQKWRKDGGPERERQFRIGSLSKTTVMRFRHTLQ